ncbi:hypothetical protein [uncultured Helcococcus sp.]|uniref:hypothetical protein n=1 Tax=uncultured Helcococcus sp. TaxID=1072508 RepID=UPI002628C4C4|nr:hypothetical protein [uncultured Helcococcus sp.]
MEKIRRMLPYLFVIILAFYLLPFLIKDTGSGMFILMFGIPIICLTVSLIYGIKNSFYWLFSMLVSLLFIPSLFIFYNESAVIYILVYGIISLVANFIGGLLSERN